MAPHTLLIERQEATAPVQGGRVAFSRIKRVITHEWEMWRPTLEWLCCCPVGEVRFNRIGPVYLAHAREWARGRELESLRWKRLYPAPISIRGKAVAVRPDRERPGCWRALSEWEAINAERVLRSFCEPLTQPCSDRWEALTGQISGEPLLRLMRSAAAEREHILQEFALQQAASRRAAAASAA